MKNYFLAARPQFMTGSIAPVTVAGAWCIWRGESIPWALWILCVIGLVLLHSAADIISDYFDTLSGADDLNEQFIPPFTGGGRAIQKGLLTPQQLLIEGLVCLAAGSAIGLYLAFLRGWVILALGAFGVVTNFFYAAPPLKLSYRGLGELVLGLDLGILAMLGTQYVLTQHMTVEMAWLGIPMSLLITEILVINQFPDAESDEMVGKRNLVVILGDRGGLHVLVGEYVLILAMTAGAVMMQWLPLTALLPLVAAIPMGVAARALEVGPRDPAMWKIACPAGVTVHWVYGVLMTVGLLIARPLGLM